MRVIRLLTLLIFTLIPSAAISGTMPIIKTETLIVLPDDGVEPIVRIIESASKRIDIVMHTLGDIRVRKALKATAKRGVKIRAMIEKYPPALGSSRVEVEKRIRDAGIFFKWANPAFKSTKQAALIVDGSAAYVSTMDLTTEDIDSSRGFIVKVLDPRDVSEISMMFEADWNRKRTKPSSSRLSWAPDLYRTRVFQLLRNTEHTLNIYAEAIRDDNMVRSIARAVNRGVTVKVLVGEYNGISGPWITKLLQAGARVRTMKKPRLRANALLSDAGHKNQKALIGSVDLSTSSIDESRGLSVIIKNGNRLVTLEKLFKLDFLKNK